MIVVSELSHQPGIFDELGEILMKKTHHFFLVPGFFGFANLGEFYYFSHPYELLKTNGPLRGIDVRVTRVPTHPTASLRKRALTLFHTIKREAGCHSGPIHIIGHSSGGLDGRLLLTPGVMLKKGLDLEPLLSRVDSLVTISTPHRGTPLAWYFGSSMGQTLLKLLSLATIYSLRFGHLPISFVFKLAGLLVQLDNNFGWRNTLADQLFGELLSDFSPTRRQQVGEYFKEVGSDQALVFQLTPDSMDVFDASTADRPGVKYGSVVTMGRRPGLGSRLASGFNPYDQVTHTAYEIMHRVSARVKSDNDVCSPEQRTTLRKYLGRLPSWRDNDGVVPSLSQVWGEVVHAIRADHLDVIGHFTDKDRNPPHVDWLASGSDFNYRDFYMIWDKVLDYCLSDPAG